MQSVPKEQFAMLREARTPQKKCERVARSYGGARRYEKITSRKVRQPIRVAGVVLDYAASPLHLLVCAEDWHAKEDHEQKLRVAQLFGIRIRIRIRF